jgi:hypothetical protein
MFGDVVLGIDHEDFEHELSAIKKAAGAKFDIELTAAHLKELVTKYKVGFWEGGGWGLLWGSCTIKWCGEGLCTLTWCGDRLGALHAGFELKHRYAADSCAASTMIFC